MKKKVLRKKVFVVSLGSDNGYISKGMKFRSIQELINCLYSQYGKIEIDYMDAAEGVKPFWKREPFYTGK